MKKFIISIFVVLLVGLIILTACSKKSCEDISDPAKKDTCQIEMLEEKIESKNSLEECSELSDEGERNICIIRFIEKSGDVSMCDSNFEGFWLSECYTRVAATSGQGDLCDSLKELDAPNKEFQRDICYYDLAVEKKNLDPCLKINSEDLRYDCIWEVADINDAVEYCEYIPDQAKKQVCITDAS